MLHKAIQNRWCRLALAVAATLLYAIGVNWFIVPMGLYTGGLLGFCQVARTLIVEALGLSPNVDFSGILYLAANVPILLLAWQALGRGFLVRTAVCTVTSSLFLSLVPPPAAPLVEETLTNCVLGGILVGFSLGIVLTCGCSTGGLDILGLWLAKKGKGFSVGRFSLSFNALLYTLCAVLFGLRAAIYSIIYTVFCALFIDRGHQQNITEQVLIFTKDEDPELPRRCSVRRWSFRQGRRVSGCCCRHPPQPPDGSPCRVPPSGMPPRAHPWKSSPRCSRWYRFPPDLFFAPNRSVQTGQHIPCGGTLRWRSPRRSRRERRHCSDKYRADRYRFPQ